MKSIAFEFEQMPRTGTLAERVIALALVIYLFGRYTAGHGCGRCCLDFCPACGYRLLSRLYGVFEEIIQKRRPSRRITEPGPRISEPATVESPPKDDVAPAAHG
jgi:hypothetical protein